MVVDQSENNCRNNNFIYEAISPRGVRNVLWKHIKTKPPGKRAGGELRLRKSKTCGHLQYLACVGCIKKSTTSTCERENLDSSFNQLNMIHNESLLGILNKCEILSEGKVEKEFCKVYLKIKKHTVTQNKFPKTKYQTYRPI